MFFARIPTKTGMQLNILCQTSNKETLAAVNWSYLLIPKRHSVMLGTRAFKTSHKELWH